MTRAIQLDGTCQLSREAVGGKAHGINAMRALGIPVPPAFVLGTEACARFAENQHELPDDAIDSLRDGIAWLEKECDRTFGAATRPLLVSVRSGAAASMPGMMDTVLNLGLTSTTRTALAQESGRAEFGANTAARFAHQFTKVVGQPPPDEVFAQLDLAAKAVFSSWFSPRASAYRHNRGLVEGGGTAVTVQAMVFGNLDERSGTGVLFSRNPMTGDATPFGEWLPGCQGEDVVSGTVDPRPLIDLVEYCPEAYRDLLTIASQLERHNRDVQDIEFTIESGRLWLLQTRVAKRSPRSVLPLAAALQREGIITEIEALGRVRGEHVAALLKPSIDPNARANAVILARGEPACPGIASGVVVTDADEAEDLADQDARDVILARPTTDPEDLRGMIAARAVITEVGGATSHAAVVSRELGRPCVVGCGDGAFASLAGRHVTVDGGTGEVFEGVLALESLDPTSDPSIVALREWVSRNPDEVPAELIAALNLLAVS